MTRGVAFACAAVIACLAFFGGHAIAGSDEQPAKAAPKGPKLDPAPAVVASAGRAVALPVVSVRQLPALAPPHRKRIVKVAPVTVTPAPVVRAPVIRRVNPTPSPAPKVTKPKQKSTPPSGGGGGGYFDDSG